MGLRPSVRGDRDSSSSALRSCSNENNNNDINTDTDTTAVSSTTTSNSSSSSTTAQSSPPQREAWTTRGQLLLNFHHAISRAINSPEMGRKCTEIAKDMSRSEQDTSQQTTPTQQNYSIADEYSAEAELIVQNKAQRDAAVRNKSIAVGLFFFVTLRTGRGLSSFLRKTIANRRYKFDNMPAAGTHHTIGQSTMANTSRILTSSSSQQQQHRQQPTKLRKVLNLTIDIALSTTLTLLSAQYIFMPRPSSYIEDMSKLPLVSGKSIYAEIVCPPLLKEYKRVMEEYGGRWPVNMGGGSGGAARASSSSAAAVVPKNNDRGVTSNSNSTSSPLTQEDVSLNIIRKFVENCSKRSKYEDALLEERTALSEDNINNQSSSAVSRLMRRLTGGDGGALSSSSSSESSDVATGSTVSTQDSMKGDQTKQRRRSKKLGTISIPSPGVPEDINVDVDIDVFTLVDDTEEVED